MMRVARAGFVVYGLALTFASLTPGDDLPDIQYNDKFAHFGAYLVFTLLAAATTRSRSTFSRLAAGLVAYGLALEFLQSLATAREPSILDAIANSAGVLAAVFVVRRYWPTSRKLL